MKKKTTHNKKYAMGTNRIKVGSDSYNIDNTIKSTPELDAARAQAEGQTKAINDMTAMGLDTIAPGAGTALQGLTSVTSSLTNRFSKDEDGFYKDDSSGHIGRIADNIINPMNMYAGILEGDPFGFKKEKRMKEQLGSARRMAKYETSQRNESGVSVLSNSTLYNDGTGGIKVEASSKTSKTLPGSPKKETDLPITAEQEERLRLTPKYISSREAFDKEFLPYGTIKSKVRSEYDPTINKKNVVKRLNELQDSRDYMKNWVKVRKSSDPVIQKELDAVKSKKLNNVDVVQTYVSKSNPSRAGAYSSKYKDVEIVDDNADNFTAIHEMSHAADDSGELLTKGETELIKRSVNPTQRFRDDNALHGVKTSYYTEPTEVKARIQVLRKAMGVKPDEVITPARLKSGVEKNKAVKNVKELIQTVPDEKALLDLMNKLGKTQKKNKENVTSVT